MKRSIAAAFFFVLFVSHYAVGQWACWVEGTDLNLQSTAWNSANSCVMVANTSGLTTIFSFVGLGTPDTIMLTGEFGGDVGAVQTSAIDPTITDPVLSFPCQNICVGCGSGWHPLS